MGSDLDDLLIHKCSVLQAAESTSGEDGRSSMSWAAGATTTTGVACRLSETTMQTRAELATLAVQASHELWADWAGVPSSLKTATAERTHRIINVLRRTNDSSVDAGPFDVKHVANVGGADELLKLYLMRIG